MTGVDASSHRCADVPGWHAEAPVADPMVALSEAALAALGHSPDEVLQAFSSTARTLVGADASGSITFHARGRTRAVTSTSHEIDNLHVVQGELGQGPAVDTLRESIPMSASNGLVVDGRWPAWAPHVVRAGYRSLICVRVGSADRTFGALTLYAAAEGAFSDRDREIAAQIGIHTSVAYTAARAVDDLHRVLDSRLVIGQAQGVLMTVLGVDADAAFAFLVRRSMERNLKLAVVAADVVASGSSCLSDAVTAGRCVSVAGRPAG